MSQLAYNERLLKVVPDHYNYYADKLVEDSVCESFITIINSAKKVLPTKVEIKVRIVHLFPCFSFGILVAVQQAQPKREF